MITSGHCDEWQGHCAFMTTSAVLTNMLRFQSSDMNKIRYKRPDNTSIMVLALLTKVVEIQCKDTIYYIANVKRWHSHYDDVIMTLLAYQITSLTVVYSIVYSGVNQRKHQSSASLAFMREIHRGPVNFPHKLPVTRKMFPFDDVIMRMNQTDGPVSLTLLIKSWRNATHATNDMIFNFAQTMNLLNKTVENVS